MHIFRYFTLIILISPVLIALGCSSGGGDSQTGSSAGASTGVTPGVWTGTFNSSTLQFPASALVTTNGSVGIDIGNGTVYYGDIITSSGSSIGGSENITPSAIVNLSVASSGTNQILVEVTQGARAIDIGDTLNLTYDDIYERASSLGNLAGTWSGNNVVMLGGSGSALDWSLTFQADGTFSGTASSLTLEGTVNLVDSTKNEYQFTMTITSSSPGSSYIGDYEGFATISDTSAMNDTLVMYLKRTGSNPILGRLILQ